jgi:hypothetical protein
MSLFQRLLTVKAETNIAHSKRTSKVAVTQKCRLFQQAADAMVFSPTSPRAMPMEECE